MTYLTLYGYFVAGIVLSVLVPIAVKWIVAARADIEKGSIWLVVWQFIRPVLMVAGGSAILGIFLLLIFLATGTKVTDITWYNAVLYGYGWDATLQKIREGRNG